MGTGSLFNIHSLYIAATYLLTMLIVSDKVIQRDYILCIAGHG